MMETSDSARGKTTVNQREKILNIHTLLTFNPKSLGRMN